MKYSVVLGKLDTLQKDYDDVEANFENARKQISDLQDEKRQKDEFNMELLTGRCNSFLFFICSKGEQTFKISKWHFFIS